MSYMSLVKIKMRSKSPNSNHVVRFSNNASLQVRLKSVDWLRRQSVGKFFINLVIFNPGGLEN